MIKRLFDIVASAAALVILAVPMGLIALAIRLESPGRALFRQRRAGWRGKAFTMLKFRSMRSDVDPYGQSPHCDQDPRMTRMGKFLRETSLDELPQLLNVLAGQMSIVGPRPLYERQAAQWDQRQRRRLDVRPGITGYAQIQQRGAMTIEDKIDRDLYYVDHMSLWLDLKIIFATFADIFCSSRRGEIYEKQYSRDSEYEDAPVDDKRD